MARRGYRAKATAEQTLIPQRTHCVLCGQPMWVAYHTHRSITTLHGVYRLTLHVRRCRNHQCERYHCPYRPEEEGGWALPHGEFGLDVIALVGALRYTAHRSIPEIHQVLCDRKVQIAERTVTHLLPRYKDVSLPRLVPREMLFFTIEQAQQLMRVARGHPLECLITLAITTGMRKGELLGLRWSDIDLEHRTLQVKRTATYVAVDGGKTRYIETEPKTQSSKRAITLPPFVVDLLHTHRARQLQARRKAGICWKDQDLVFTTAQGNHYCDSLLRNQYARLLRDAMLPRVRFHDLRHSAATILLSLGVNIKVIQELLGHSHIETTLGVYSHVIPGIQQEAMNTLHSLYTRVK
ncbi:MAG: site-specific integrase [Ktedonobacteraceae bacterium]|nr:site-specific integrase [Ktedonobacteraceae bacterium]MBO0794801.1 site-specific integrase [Ktedonobacteraceae bacterium]